MDVAKEHRISRMLTVREVARILNIHPNTVRHWSDQGVLRAHRINRRGDRRFEQRAIALFLRKFETGRAKAESDR